MTDTAGPRVDACVGALPGWQHAFCREGRHLVHAAGSQVTETIKRTNRPASSWRAAFVYDRGIVPGAEGSSPAALPARPAAPWRSGRERQSPRPR